MDLKWHTVRDNVKRVKLTEEGSTKYGYGTTIGEVVISSLQFAYLGGNKWRRRWVRHNPDVDIIDIWGIGELSTEQMFRTRCNKYKTKEEVQKMRDIAVASSDNDLVKMIDKSYG